MPGTIDGSDAAHFAQRFIEWYLASALLIVGTSLLLRSKAWIAAMASAVTHPLAPFLSGLYALLVGLPIILLHNVWTTDARVLVTALGWLAVATGTLFLVIPASYAAIVRRMPMTPQLIALRGLVRVAIGGTIVGYLLSQG